MKKKLLSLAVLFISGFAYSQVGIGVMQPNKSAQLEIKSDDKGVLIPRVKLKGTKDVKTITSGNVESLLVFNMTNDSNIKPGYYYWDGKEWSKLLSGDDATSIENLSFNIEGGQLILKDDKGIEVSIDLDKLNKVTTIIDQGDGSYVYTNEINDTVTIDVKGSVINNFSEVVNNKTVKELIEKISKEVYGNVTYDTTSNTFNYTDASGKTKAVNISEIVKANETKTTLKKITNIDKINDVDHNRYSLEYTNEESVKETFPITEWIKEGQSLTSLIVDKKSDNGKITYTLTYRDENGNSNSVDISSIIKADQTLTSLNVEKLQVGGTDVYTLIYKDEKGVSNSVDISSLVKSKETTTTLTYNDTDGTYVYSNEVGSEVTINIPAAVSKKFETIVNEGDVQNILNRIIKEVDGNVYFDGNNFKYTITNQAGKKEEKIIDITNLVKAAETTTTLTYNDTDGTYVYSNEVGSEVTINIPAAVSKKFETIVNEGDVQNILNRIIKEVDGNVYFDGYNFKYTITNQAGNKEEKTVDITNLVKAAETTTTLTYNDTDGTYTYKNEVGSEVTINIPAAVSKKFETIVNEGDVQNILNRIIKEVDGNVYFDGYNFKYTITNQAGNKEEKTVDITNLVKAAETTTTLTYNDTDGTYTYKNEVGSEVTINIPAAVSKKFETIVNEGDVQNILNRIIKEVDGNVYFDGNNFKYTITNQAGNKEEKTINITDLVKAAETKTTLTYNDNDGTYVYKNEVGAEVTINIPAAVTKKFQTIVNEGEVKNILNKIIKEVDGNVYYDGNNFKYTITNQSGNKEEKTINITDLVKAAETKTTIVDNGDGTYVYTNEELATVTIDVPADVTNQFQTIANNDNVKRILNQIIKDAEGNVSYDGTNFKYTITNQSGNKEEKTINITDLVKAAETKTTLTYNDNDGTYVYKNEDLAEVTINIPAAVSKKFETIVNEGDVKNILNRIIKEVDGNVYYDGNNFKYTITNQAGNKEEKIVDITKLVKAAETTTTLTYNDIDGTYVYSNEVGAEVTINIPAAVSKKFETIVNEGDVKNILNRIIKEVDGNVYYDGNNFKYTITNQAGNKEEKTINITDLVKAAETKTTLTYNDNDGTYVYKNEDLAEVTINIPAAVSKKFETIVNDVDVKRILNTIIKEVDGNVSYDGTNFNYSTTDVSGNKIDKQIDITNLVKAAETVTILSYEDASGDLVYKNESKDPNDTDFRLNIPDVVGDKFDVIVQNQKVKDAINSFVTNVSLANGDVKFDGNTISYKDNNGVAHTLTIKQFVEKGETITTLSYDDTTGNLSYKNEEAARQGADASKTINVNIPDVVINKFEDIVNNTEVKRKLTEIIKLDETLTSLKVENTGTADAPVYKLTYYDETGNSSTVDISLVKAKETETTLETVTNTDNVNGVIHNRYSLKYTNEQSKEELFPITKWIKEGQTLTSLTVDKEEVNGKDVYTLTYKDEKGNSNAVDISSLVKSKETLTSLEVVNKGTADKPVYELTYHDEAGNSKTVDIATLLKSKETLTSLNVDKKRVGDKDEYSLTYKDERGDSNTVNISSLIKADETKTTLVKVVNTDTKDGVVSNRYSLEYTNEKAEVETFPITEWIKEGQTLTSLTVDKEEVNGNDVYTLTYKDEKGNSNAVDISLLQAKETLTELKVVDKGTTDKPNHELTYKNEAGSSEIVDISSIVKVNETVTSLLLDDTETKTDPDTNAELKVMKLAYKDEKGVISKIDIESIIKTNESLTSLQYDTQRHSLIYRDEEGVAKEFMLVDLVGDVENLTTLSLDRDNKKLIYIDEHKTPHNLDLAPIIQEPWFGVATNEGAISNTEDIYTQGWVGIGIDKPSGLAGEKLRVNGSISVVNGTYADYVFENYFDGFSNIKYDYKFKDLKTVEDYIKTNRHLPGITPIHELEKTAEGYSFNISELSIQLLEKTEELYLHMIEQKNVIDQKNQQIKMLEDANKDIQDDLEAMQGDFEAMQADYKAMQERIEKLERLLLNK